MRTAALTSLAIAASTLISAVSAADLDPIVTKGSSEFFLMFYAKPAEHTR